MADPPQDTILEEREDFMVSPTGGIPTLRLARFLKPTVTSIDGPTLKPPSISLSSEPNLPLKVTFPGWRDPQKNWKDWVDQMHSIHQSVWKQAGIYNSIMASTCTIRRNNDLIFGMAERWCSETNTFLFPWGESTITLEDIMVLGGFSVLGSPVSTPLETEDLIKVEENLNKERKEIIRSRSQKATHCRWIKQLMGNDKDLEHEAFLSLWLSKSVFLGKVFNTISKQVFPIASHLSRGTKIALAPAVLASIYRDLGMLKDAISASTELKLTLSSPLWLVQVWVWERLTTLQPKPRVLDIGEPRLARWDLKKMAIKNLKSAIDSGRENFLWRPYGMTVENWLNPKFYKEKEEWECVSSDLGEEEESFARCLRVCELVGMDCTELYLPHRVAMQFGMDQDLPGWVNRSNANEEMAWKRYSRPISDEKLYIPSRLFESDVTSRYLEWWEKSVFGPQDGSESAAKEQVSSTRLSEGSKDRATCRNEESFMSPVEEVEQNEVADERKDSTATEIIDTCSEGGSSVHNTSCSNKYDQGEGYFSVFFDRQVIELDTRISRLERMVAEVKVARHAHKGG